LRLKERRRNLLGRTGCGLCGAESLDHALRLPVITDVQSTRNQQNLLSAAHIQSAFHAIQAKQVLQQSTGATHACAWVDSLGEVVLIREDVGRHNAMDKLIGGLAKLPNQENGFVLTSSRASVEMVQKIATAGIQVLAAISAPTGLAIRIAETYGVTLIGFLRDQQFVVYTHQHRIQINP
jgi:FdhD protein